LFRSNGSAMPKSRKNSKPKKGKKKKKDAAKGIIKAQTKEKKAQKKAELIEMYGKYHCADCNTYPRSAEQHKQHMEGQRHANRVARNIYLAERKKQRESGEEQATTNVQI